MCCKYISALARAVPPRCLKQHKKSMNSYRIENWPVPYIYEDKCHGSKVDTYIYRYRYNFVVPITRVINAIASKFQRHIKLYNKLHALGYANFFCPVR